MLIYILFPLTVKKKGREPSPDEGINIAFPVTMETQHFGPLSFLESFLILLLGLTPCCEYSYHKVSSPRCRHYADQVAFLVCLFRWDAPDLWERKFIICFFLIPRCEIFIFNLKNIIIKRIF